MFSLAIAWPEEGNSFLIPNFDKVTDNLISHVTLSFFRLSAPMGENRSHLVSKVFGKSVEASLLCNVNSTEVQKLTMFIKERHPSL